MGSFQQACGFPFFLISLFLSSLLLYGVGSFPRRENLPGGRNKQWELGEIAAEAILLTQQLLLEKSLFTGKVFRKKPNTCISRLALGRALGE